MLYILDMTEPYEYHVFIMVLPDGKPMHWDMLETAVSCYLYEYSDAMVLTDLNTGADYRRQGYAEKLLKHVRKLFDKDIELSVDQTNTSAIALYEKLGFYEKEVEEDGDMMIMRWSKNDDKPFSSSS